MILTITPNPALDYTIRLDEFEIGKSALFCTGLSVEIPEGFEGQIRPRSSLGKHGVHCYFGTIDSDYRGELMIRLQLITGEAWDVFKGDRIAQLVIAPVARATIQEVDELSETARGAGGWGSTGR